MNTITLSIPLLVAIWTAAFPATSLALPHSLEILAEKASTVLAPKAKEMLSQWSGFRRSLQEKGPPKQETPKQETPKQETPKQEPPQQEPPSQPMANTKMRTRTMTSLTSFREALPAPILYPSIHTIRGLVRPALPQSKDTDGVVSLRITRRDCV